MNPLLSWAMFIAFGCAVYYINQRKKPNALRNLANSNTVQNTKSVFLSAGSGAETGEKKKQPKKKRKAALSNSTTQKDLVSTDDAGSDGDVAEEVDSADVAKRLQAMKEASDGKLTPSSRSNRQLAPHSPLTTASQTSSTGADADIDEEDGTPLPESEYPSLPKSSSTDPSDMLEEQTGPQVMRVIPSSQPPRLQKKKKSSGAVETGVHANKNQKKKDKKKAEKDANRSEQMAALERHRAQQRAAEAARQTSKPAQAPSAGPNPWSKPSGPATSSMQVPPAIAASSDTTLLDTFVHGSQESSHDSEEEKSNLKSTMLGESMWEDIPAHISGPEPEWNEVKSKKGRKERKPASTSGDEVQKPAGRASGGNNFNLLEQSGESVAGSDSKTTDSERWTEEDEWAVDPSS